MAKQLRDQGKDVTVLLGEVELERWKPSQVDPLRAVATVANPQSLLELLAHVHPARCFIGNDSGPGHLAGILGTPTVSIFGANDPTRWKPLGPAVEVVSGASLEAIGVEQVVEAVERVTAKG